MNPMKLIVDDSDESFYRLQVLGKISCPVTSDIVEPPDLVRKSRGRDVLVSMAEAEFIDSSGINWLLQCHKALKESGTRMCLHSIPPNIQQVFGMLKLQRVLSLCSDESEAISRKP